MTDRRLSAETREVWIIEYLRSAGSATPQDIAHQLALTVAHTRTVVRDLSIGGKIRPAPGRRGLGRRGRLPTRYEVAT